MATRITHKTSSNVWQLTDRETGAELGTIYREVGDTDANFGQVVFKAFNILNVEAHLNTLGAAQRWIERTTEQAKIDARYAEAKRAEAGRAAREALPETPIHGTPVSGPAELLAPETLLSVKRDMIAFFRELGVSPTEEGVRFALRAEGTPEREIDALMGFWPELSPWYARAPLAPVSDDEIGPIARALLDALKEI